VRSWFVSAAVPRLTCYSGRFPVPPFSLSKLLPNLIGRSFPQVNEAMARLVEVGQGPRRHRPGVDVRQERARTAR
jgi:hypothetical protein